MSLKFKNFLILLIVQSSREGRDRTHSLLLLRFGCPGMELVPDPQLHLHEYLLDD